MKRLLSFLLCVALLLPAAATAHSQPTADEAAQALHSLGLFKGTAADRFDEESMALDRPATRIEALVMFLRLLGKEEAAHTGEWSHHFSDVDPWAASYVGYAWQNGLTTGIGGDKFASTRTITLNEYLTFLLRAFGYSEVAGDFSWNTASDKGVEIGLCDVEFVARCQSGVTRGDLVLLSYAALSLPLKGKTQTLAGYLSAQSAVPADAFAALGIPLEIIPTDGDKPQQPDLEGVLTLTNQVRTQATAQDGITRKPLVLDDELSALAQIRAVEIVETFDHTRPDGRSCFTVFDDNGFSYTLVAENIAYGYTTPELVVNAWRNSSGHYQNMVNPGLGRLGVGRVGNHWVQLFAN